MNEAYSIKIVTTKKVEKHTSVPFSGFYGAHVLSPARTQESLVTTIHDRRILRVEKKHVCVYMCRAAIQKNWLLNP